jgi:hypothetical protein
MAAKKKATKKASADVESNVAPEAPEAIEAQVPEEQANQLTIVDLQTLAQAIDMASRRGAYGAAEMADVGAVYKKLTGFLNMIAEQSKAQGGQ